jgi:hypothetical protein
MDNLPPELNEAWPGLVGGLVAFFMGKGNFALRVTIGVSGMATAWFMAGVVSKWFGMPLDVAKFLLGVFGGFLLGRTYDLLAQIDNKAIGASITAWIKRRLRG